VRLLLVLLRLGIATDLPELLRHGKFFLEHHLHNQIFVDQVNLRQEFEAEDPHFFVHSSSNLLRNKESHLLQVRDSLRLVE